jgi:flagellar hook-length control protein FliK
MTVPAIETNTPKAPTQANAPATNASSQSGPAFASLLPGATGHAARAHSSADHGPLSAKPIGRRIAEPDRKNEKASAKTDATGGPPIAVPTQAPVPPADPKPAGIVAAVTTESGHDGASTAAGPTDAASTATGPQGATAATIVAAATGAADSAGSSDTAAAAQSPAPPQAGSDTNAAAVLPVAQVPQQPPAASTATPPAALDKGPASALDRGAATLQSGTDALSIATAIHAAAPATAGTAQRASSASSATAGGTRVTATATFGTPSSLAQPSLLAALQAQEQQSNGDTPAAATPANVGAPDASQDGTDTADPTAAFTLPEDPAPVSTAAIDAAVESSLPTVTPTAADHKTAADPTQTVAALQAPEAAQPADAATPVAVGPATTAASAGTTTTAGTAPNTPAGPTLPATLPTVQLALAITRNASNGTQSFTMQLKPERLGTVEVKLDVDEKGHATANFVADHPDTLALLRQDAHHLVKSLNDAGVNADAGSLSFSLRDSGGTFAEAQERRGNSGQTLRNAAASGQDGSAAEAPTPVYQTTGSSRLYDIRA